MRESKQVGNQPVGTNLYGYTDLYDVFIGNIDGFNKVRQYISNFY